MERDSKISILITHWAQNPFRSETMRKCINSVIETAPNAEIIVIDNGEELEDSKYLLELTHQKKIACYVRNRKNMHFSFARNQALQMCSVEYIVISDNDILYQPGWLEECIDFLKKHEGKYLVTPLPVDRAHWPKKYNPGELDSWKLNMRAGSNSWVMRRSDFEKIGYFRIHRVAGTKWTDTYVRLGYLMACMPEPKARDMAFTKGYNLNKEIDNFEL